MLDSAFPSQLSRSIDTQQRQYRAKIWAAAIADSLDIGTKRRLTVATQFLRCSPLLVLHDVLEGLNTGDALAIVRAVADMTR